jgi:RNA recognition motif-containing protein
MFDGCPPYQSIVYGLNNSWYVTFETEEQTQKAYQILMGKTFNGKPIYVNFMYKKTEFYRMIQKFVDILKIRFYIKRLENIFYSFFYI